MRPHRVIFYTAILFYGAHIASAQLRFTAARKAAILRDNSEVLRAVSTENL